MARIENESWLVVARAWGKGAAWMGMSANGYGFLFVVINMFLEVSSGNGYNCDYTKKPLNSLL